MIFHYKLSTVLLTFSTIILLGIPAKTPRFTTRPSQARASMPSSDYFISKLEIFTCTTLVLQHSVQHSTLARIKTSYIKTVDSI